MKCGNAQRGNPSPGSLNIDFGRTSADCRNTGSAMGNLSSGGQPTQPMATKQRRATDATARNQLRFDTKRGVWRWCDAAVTTSRGSRVRKTASAEPKSSASAVTSASKRGLAATWRAIVGDARKPRNRCGRPANFVRRARNPRRKLRRAIVFAAGRNKVSTYPSYGTRDGDI